MAYAQATISAIRRQSPRTDTLRSVFDVLPDRQVLAALYRYRWTGRRGFPLLALWHAYVASFILNLPSTNALIRELDDNPTLTEACGFDLDAPLPGRRTFNRFIERLSHHQDAVDRCMAGVTSQLADLLPGFGEKVAVDSTTVKTHANPNRRIKSDPEASWTAKNSARAKEGGKDWHYGYKYHAVADATYGLPLAGFVTTAKRNDSPELASVIEKAKATLPWFKPTHVIADRGYDSAANNHYVAQEGAVPIILMRKPSNGATLYKGIYTEKGVPTCLGMVSMDYVRSDADGSHVYRCRGEGCILKAKKGTHYCADEVRVDPNEDLRLFGLLRRDSQEWKGLYALRQSIERVFKGCKESRRLERHHTRGLRKVSLHAAMSVLAFQATALVEAQAGRTVWMRWMVRRVA
jgi:IS5 family transposase